MSETVNVSVKMNTINVAVAMGGTVNATVTLAGPSGPGVASGGSTGQVLTKNSGNNYDTIWQDPSDNAFVIAMALAL